MADRRGYQANCHANVVADHCNGAPGEESQCRPCPRGGRWCYRQPAALFIGAASGRSQASRRTLNYALASDTVIDMSEALCALGGTEHEQNGSDAGVGRFNKGIAPDDSVTDPDCIVDDWPYHGRNRRLCAVHDRSCRWLAHARRGRMRAGLVAWPRRPVSSDGARPGLPARIPPRPGRRAVLAELN
jgi:hypothetical protein